MSKVSKKPTSNGVLIKPSVSIEGHTNPFIPYFNDNELELKSVGYIKMPGSNNYVAYTITTVGGKVTEIICDEPNMKMVAEESAKISFVEHFVDSEE